MSNGNNLLTAMQEVGITLDENSRLAPTEISEAMLGRIGGGTGYVREHDQFYQENAPGGGSFWKSVWRYTPIP